MIDKKLIILALEAYKAFLVKRDISEHDQTLAYYIRVQEQIKLMRAWKKQIKCSMSGYIIVS